MSKLKDEIDAYEVVKAQKVPADTLAVMSGATEDLIATGIEKNTLKTGDTVPKVSLPNQKNEITDLAEHLNNSLVILNFYRGGWCPYCNLELNALQKMVPEFNKLGAKLVAISPEVPDHSLTTQEKNDLSFDILYDKANKLAKQFGLVFTLPSSIQSIYDSFGIDVSGHNGDDSFELPIPATYIINQDGEIIYHFVDADYTKRAEPSDILTALQNQN